MADADSIGVGEGDGEGDVAGSHLALRRETDLHRLARAHHGVGRRQRQCRGGQNGKENAVAELTGTAGLPDAHLVPSVAVAPRHVHIRIGRGGVETAGARPLVLPDVPDRESVDLDSGALARGVRRQSTFEPQLLQLRHRPRLEIDVEVRIAGVLYQTGKRLVAAHRHIRENTGVVDCQHVALFVGLIEKGVSVWQHAVAGADPGTALRRGGVAQHRVCLVELHRGGVEMERVVVAGVRRTFVHS